MGMTIDDHIKILKSYHNGFTGWASNFQESIDVALNIMHKYQKIEQIAFPLQFCTTDKLNHEAIMKICEVLEDGNDD